VQFLSNPTAPALGRNVASQSEAISNRYQFNDLFSATWLAEAVGTCVKLDLAEEISEQPTSVEEVARRRQFDCESLYRLLRALATNGIFVESQPRIFEHTGLSRQLRGDHPYSYKPMAALWSHPTVRRSWGAFNDAVKNGESGIKSATGQTLYQALSSSSDFARVFNTAMISNSAHASESIAIRIPLGKTKRLVDLGGGVGTLLATIVTKHPHIEGVLFELEYMYGAAEEYFKNLGLEKRVTFVPGSFLDFVPGDADTYLVKNTLWNFVDEDVLKVFRNVRAVMNADSRFYIIEYIINSENAPWTTLFDLQMLNLPGGRARTKQEYEQMLGSAGLRVVSTEYVEDQTILEVRTIEGAGS
jgi:hypothetical protein